ncbi:MAG TPA: aminoglycoside phosphotransferase family protein [Chloroflexia bacterium]|nr:aminoglycoside phosphotransferase family protein [Chloroflexia bacterium]
MPLISTNHQIPWLSALPLFTGSPPEVLSTTRADDYTLFTVTSSDTSLAVKHYFERERKQKPLITRPAEDRARAESLALETYAPRGIAHKLLWSGDAPAHVGGCIVIYPSPQGVSAARRQLANKEIELYASALRTVHSEQVDLTMLSPRPRNLDAWWLQAHELYRDIPANLLRALPATIEDLLARLTQTVAADSHAHKRFWQGAALTPIHGTPFPYNLLLSDGTVTLVDWQLFGLGDPSYEVAATSCMLAESSGPLAADTLAESYLSHTDDIMLERRIKIYRRVWQFGYVLQLLRSIWNSAQYREAHDARSGEARAGLVYHFRTCMETYGWTPNITEVALEELQTWMGSLSTGVGSDDSD